MQKIFFPILLAFTVFGCEAESTVPAAKLEVDSKSETKPELKPKIKQEVPKVITLRGTVRYKNLEGGFWGFEGNDGNKYMPSGLNKTLLVDGMIIEVTGIIEEDESIMTIQQFGKIFRVTGSKMIDNSEVKGLNSY